ncbi:S-adenosyl-L-methionine-dependent methyltransferase [Cantharellus anzutake]|uniref:S-adenosyl-L-methionine-dependent methyltransferase n=1 Tax=Cantharellus anzutake TaxID=1750568 RepID=UPI0019042F50|nr:S-adenosyl-L-methionine-dependent methyltransferase [Cantharellus anzutake]KAF8335495.1 S-adenosyl-L-methionine-dependent methyltransferase [Cantharellus anzutake]
MGALTAVNIIKGPQLIAQILIFFFVSARNLFLSRATQHSMDDGEEFRSDPETNRNHGGSMISMIISESHHNTVPSDGMEPEEERECSVQSYTSERDWEMFFVEENGREFNRLNRVYPLPADVEEWGRLADLHTVLKLCLGSLYQAATIVDHVLAAKEGEKKRILDCGCGGGEWAIEMAKKFPHAEVIGVDLAPGPIRDLIPDNCRFEFEDLNEELSHFYGKFDVVHARSCFLGINNYRCFLDRLVRFLKPGGILLLAESPLWLAVPEPGLATDGENLEGQLMQMFRWVEDILQRNGSDIRGINNLRTLVEEHPQLENEEFLVMTVPVGPWMTGRDEYIGGLMRENVMKLAHALGPALLKAGHSLPTINGWIESVEGVLLSPSAKFVSNWIYCSATCVLNAEAGATTEDEEEGEEMARVWSGEEENSPQNRCLACVQRHSIWRPSAEPR